MGYQDYGYHNSASFLKTFWKRTSLCYALEYKEHIENRIKEITTHDERLKDIKAMKTGCTTGNMLGDLRLNRSVIPTNQIGLYSRTYLPKTRILSD